MKTGRPLEGVRVLDFTQFLPGPYCTYLLALLGAEVTKVEPPKGDPARAMYPYFFSTVNRGKRSVAIDLKDDRGRSMAVSLARDSDVLVEGFRPGTMARLGLSYEDLTPANPGLVYCSLSGYGQAATPYREWPGHNINYEGVAGVLTCTGEDAKAVAAASSPVAAADLGGALFATVSILAALYQKRGSGRGGHIDLALTDAALALVLPRIADWVAHGGARSPRAGAYDVFTCADEKLLSVGALEDIFFRNLCRALDRDDLAADARLAGFKGRAEQREYLHDQLAAEFLKRSRDAWLERLSAADVPAAPVNRLDELFEDPHVRGRGVFGLNPSEAELLIGFPALFDGGTLDPGDAWPLGAQTMEIIGNLGYSTEEVVRLARDGVVVLPGGA